MISKALVAKVLIAVALLLIFVGAAFAVTTRNTSSASLQLVPAAAGDKTQCVQEMKRSCAKMDKAQCATKMKSGCPSKAGKDAPATTAPSTGTTDPLDV